MKDTRIRYDVAEREAVRAHEVRCFCLSNQSLDADQMAARFLDNLDAIEAACSVMEPFVYAVHTNRIERLQISGKQARLPPGATRRGAPSHCGVLGHVALGGSSVSVVDAVAILGALAARHREVVVQAL